MIIRVFSASYAVMENDIKLNKMEKQLLRYFRGYPFLRNGWGSQIYTRKSASIKLLALPPPPSLALNIFQPIPTLHLNLLNRVNCIEINSFWTKWTHHLWSSCNSHFGHQNFMTLFIFPNIYDPIYLKPLPLPLGEM